MDSLNLNIEKERKHLDVKVKGFSKCVYEEPECLYQKCNRNIKDREISHKITTI